MDNQNNSYEQSEELLKELFVETSKHLIALIKSGEAKPAEVTAAINLLKNNQIGVPSLNMKEFEGDDIDLPELGDDFIAKLEASMENN